MNQLFLNDYISHFNLTNPSNTNIYISCQQAYFEIKDDSNKNLSIHSQSNIGEAKIANPNHQLIEIINYDKFVSSLDANFQYKRKRCDLMMSSNQNFILGELKDRQSIRDARKKAKKQLLESLTDVLSVPQIESYINTKAT